MLGLISCRFGVEQSRHSLDYERGAFEHFLVCKANGLNAEIFEACITLQILDLAITMNRPVHLYCKPRIRKEEVEPKSLDRKLIH